MSDDIRFSEAQDNDVQAISSFFKEAWRQAGPGAPGFSGADDDVIAEISAPKAVRARIGGPERRMFLAWQEESVVGFSASRRLTAETVELAGVVVLQSMVGRHIGTPLVEAAIASARDHQFQRMMVSTEIDNERAIGFYRALGFEVSTESSSEVEGVEVLLQQLELAL